MTLPAGWPSPADVETLPTVWLDLEGSAWPPAAGDRPAGVVPVGTWSSERELVGSALPGSVRVRTGLSVGDAQATIGQVAGAPLAPWAVSPARRVAPGGRAQLYATHGGHDDAARIELGDWLVAPTSGALLRPDVSVDLVERQVTGRRQRNQLPESRYRCDPVWVVDRLARQAGYYSTPPTAPSAVYSMPTAGGYTPEVGSVAVTVEAPRWGRTTGPIGPEGGTTVQCRWDYAEPVLRVTDVPIYLTLNVLGTVRISFGYIPPYACEVEIRPGGVFAVRNGATAPWVTGTYVQGLDPAHPRRVQLRITRAYLGAAFDFASYAFAASARSSADAAWSATINDSSGLVTDSVSDTMWIQPQNTVSTFASVQLTHSADPVLWEPATADLDPLGGRMVGPWLPADLDAWTGIQETCSAHLGAAWVTRDRKLVCRDRNYLAGVGRGRTTIDVGKQVADLGWTSDPADTADRLEVTYALADEAQVNYSTVPWTGLTVWESPDAIELPPGATVEVVADVEPFANLYSATEWRPAWLSEDDPDTAEILSLWCAYPNRDGAGAHPADSAVTVTHSRESIGRVIISLRNNTPTTLYTVDATGQPCLILRGWYRVTRGTTAPVVRGLPADAATNPITVDLGVYVQRAEDAEAIADYLWARSSTQAWRADSVQVKLDWTLDIGDLVRLTHAASDLEVDALVTKVALSGQPGQITQTLDLVLIPPTWAEFDEAWTGKTWADFDALWAGKAWTDFDFDPTRST